MKKIIPFAVGSLMFAHSVWPSERPVGKELKAYLNGKQYETEMGFYRELTFSDGKYSIANRQMMEGAGTFEVRGATLVLHNEDKTAEGNGYPKECKLVWNSNSPSHSEEIKCTGGERFFLKSSLRAEGTEFVVEGEPVIILGKKFAELITKVVYRQKPSKQAKALRCESGSSPVVPGMYLTVYARTRAKVKVDKWENYWYYVYNNYTPEGTMDPQTGQALGCEAPPAWIFGEFLRFK